MVPICDDVPVVPGLIVPPVVEPGPEVWATTKGAAAKTTAMANTIALRNFLDMCFFSSSIRLQHE
jgi:hypothetical protein